MKRVFALLLAGIVLLCGCGVSQKEYDDVLKERDDYKTKIYNMENLMKVREAVTVCRISIEKDYEKAEILLKFIEKGTGDDIKDMSQQLKELYEKTVGALDAISKTFDIVGDVSEIDQEQSEQIVSSVENIYSEWNKAIEAIESVFEL